MSPLRRHCGRRATTWLRSSLCTRALTSAASPSPAGWMNRVLKRANSERLLSHVAVLYMVIPAWTSSSSPYQKSLFRFFLYWFPSLWRTAMWTTGSHFGLRRYDLFISPGALGGGAPRDGWRGGIKTLMSTTWVEREREGNILNREAAGFG